MNILNEVSKFFSSQGLDPLLAGFICGIIVCVFARVGIVRNKTKGKELIRRNVITRAKPLVSVAQALGASNKMCIKINGEEKEVGDLELAEIMSAIKGGKKIEAIKLLRESTGLELKEAKDLVEVMQKTHLQ